MSATAHAIPFTKLSACGNDFLIIDAAHAPADLASISRRMCERHNGIGADGVEWLFPDTRADVFARLFNADGSEAEVSGNGTRCVAAELCARTRKDQFIIRTGAGLKTCRLIGRRDSTFEFEADMGQPVVGGRLSLDAMSPRAVGTEVSMGNPHFVVFVEQFAEGWQQQAARIAAQPQFPHGVNVEYVRISGPNEIEIRLFERGLGETQSSGTGSCAAAVAAVAGGQVSSPVTVVAPGGAQTVRWDKNVCLTGPATLICRGEFII
jgi:diaminopimelate epimerase